MDKQIKGQLGEDLAVQYLVSIGYSILKRNKVIYMNKKKWLEIDILAQKDNQFFLFEVKFRKSDKFGSVYETISTKKINSIAFFIEKSIIPYTPYLIAITPYNSTYKIELIPIFR
jgi:Holliday junction resolvase-like predicted endonuclease